jgi:hypothetical protein
MSGAAGTNIDPTRPPQVGERVAFVTCTQIASTTLAAKPDTNKAAPQRSRRSTQ